MSNFDLKQSVKENTAETIAMIAWLLVISIPGWAFPIAILVYWSFGWVASIVATLVTFAILITVQGVVFDWLGVDF